MAKNAEDAVDQPMPPRLRNPLSRISRYRLPIRRHRRCPLDHQPARRVIEAQEVELLSRRRVEDIGEGDLQRRRKRRHSRRLNRDVEGMLQHARRQHVAHQFGRHGADPDLTAAHHIAVGVDQRPRLHFELQLRALLVGQVRRRRRIDADLGGRAVTYGLQDRRLQPRQIDLLPLLVGGHRFARAHAAHDGVVVADFDRQVEDHFGVESAAGRVARRAPVDRQLDVAGRHLVEVEGAVSVGVDDVALEPEDIDLGAGNRIEEDIVGGVQDAVGAGADVVESHRLQVIARVEQAPADRRAGDRRDADRREAVHEAAASRAIAVGV